MSAFEPSPVGASRANVPGTLVTPWSPASDRKIYGVWLGVVWAAVLGGFGLDFTRYLGEAPAPPFILHFHAVVYVLWLGLVSFQILWIETGKVHLHMQLGWATVALSVVMVPLGLAAALVDQARRRVHPAVLFGAALLWTGEIIVTLLNFSPAWRQAMVRLVNAWGYPG